MAAGLAVAAAGFVWLTKLEVDTNYLADLLVPELVIGFGLGLVFTTAASTGLIDVDRRDAGVASALLNASEQVSSALGIALLNTIAASATTSYLAVHGHSPAVAFLVTLGLLRSHAEGYTTAPVANTTGPRLERSIIYYLVEDPASLAVARLLAEQIPTAQTLAMPEPPPLDRPLNGATVALLLGRDAAGQSLAELQND